MLCVDSLDPGVHRGPPDYLNEGARYEFADLMAWTPDRAAQGSDAVVHCAALGGVARANREPANVIGGNVVGTARLIESMRVWSGLRRVVLASSFSVYGAAYRYRCQACGACRDGDRQEAELVVGKYDVLCSSCGGETAVLPLDTSANPAPLETYGASKLMQELCFRGFDACPVIILRQSSVYGPRLRLEDGEATVIARLAGWIAKGVPPTLLEDGRQLRDWVEVGDVVRAMLAVIDGREADPIVNVCTGVPTQLVEACDAIAHALAVDCSPDIVGGYRAGDMRHCLGDPAAFARLIGRDPTPFARGVERWLSGRVAAGSAH